MDEGRQGVSEDLYAAYVCHVRPAVSHITSLYTEITTDRKSERDKETGSS